MKTLATLRHNDLRGFAFLQLDKSNRLAVIDSKIVSEKYANFRRAGEESKALRRANQAEEHMLSHLSADMDNFFKHSGWKETFASSATWTHWSHFENYVDANKNCMHIPRSQLLWKEEQEDIRLITSNDNSCILAGFGKAISCIAQEWRHKLQDVYGDIFPLYRYLLCKMLSFYEG